METINTIALADPAITPTDAVLEEVLGPSYAAYCQLLDLFKSNELTPEWRYYNDGKAWLCKVQKKKKTIVWMSAWHGYMQVTIYVPLRIIEKVYECGIIRETINRIENTKNVGKSKPCIFELHDSAIISELEKVMHFKISQK